jgi:hypothetical protein
MFNFIKKIFKKDDDINSMFYTKKDLEQEITIEGKYNKQFLIDNINRIISENNLDIDFLSSDIKNISLVFLKFIKEQELKRFDLVDAEIGWRNLTEEDENELVKWDVYYEKHFTRLFYKIYAKEDLNDIKDEKNYTYKVKELLKVLNISKAEDELFFKDKWQELLEQNKEYTKPKNKIKGIKWKMK